MLRPRAGARVGRRRGAPGREIPTNGACDDPRDAEPRAGRAVTGVPDGVVRQIAGLTGGLRHRDEVLDRDGPRPLPPLDGQPADSRLLRLADEYDLTQAEADLLLLA